MLEEIDKSIHENQDDMAYASREMKRKVKGIDRDSLVEKIKNKGIDPKDVLKGVYEDIILILKEFTDLREDYYPLIAIWIIGTYFHKEFESFPYLFINAMRGSGKTRLLKLIASMSHQGEVLSSLSESVLFRTAAHMTFCIDEFESIGKRENGSLRELLNAGYKKGSKVKRMRKQGETHVVEEFEVYCPIAMANIWGMEEVLGDRCISLILEKSDNPQIIMLIENFHQNQAINDIKVRLTAIKCSKCSVVTSEMYYQEWNEYVKALTTLTTYNTYITLTTLTTQQQHFFNNIKETGLKGRDLELFFPLFLISYTLSPEAFEDLLLLAKKISKEKKIEEITESRDVMLFDFISRQDGKDFAKVKELTSMFRTYVHDDENEETWITTKWFGRALKRLNLSIDKKRTSSGIEVRLNILKAQKKMGMFKVE